MVPPCPSPSSALKSLALRGRRVWTAQPWTASWGSAAGARVRGSGAPGLREEGRPAGRTRSRAVGEPASPERFSSHPSSHRVTAANPGAARLTQEMGEGWALASISPVPSSITPSSTPADWAICTSLCPTLPGPKWGTLRGDLGLKACDPCSRQGPLSQRSGAEGVLCCL